MAIGRSKATGHDQARCAGESLALRTYDVDAKVVSKGDDGTTVVEYTATNETTLGSALRIPGIDYDALNRAAGDHGPFLRVTERFTWTENVKL